MLLFGLNLQSAAAQPSFDIYVKFSRDVSQQNEYRAPKNSPDQVNARFQAERLQSDVMTILWEHDFASLEKTFKLPEETLQNVWRIAFPTEAQAQAAIVKLKQHELTVYAETVPQNVLFETPDDLQPEQWHLREIEAEAAWDISTGDSDVKIAIIDDAFVIHEDMGSVYWINPDEIPNNLIDDDGNGYVDDIRGFNVATNRPNNVLLATVSENTFDHGSHCAGIAAAQTDNGRGIASIGHGISIIPVRAVVNGRGHSQFSRGLEGIQYAIAAGADIISMSWGSTEYSETYALLVQAAYARGILLIAAAGNVNSPIPMYPAAYDNVLSVGATDPGGIRAAYSNYGQHVDLMAPGTNIYSLGWNRDIYSYKTGTSMACPLVAGLAGLMLSHRVNATPAELRECLLNSCVDIDAQNPEYAGQLGAGLINARAAMACLSQEVTAEFEAAQSVYCPGAEVRFRNLSSGTGELEYEWSFPGGTPATSQDKDPVVTYALPGNYDVGLTVRNSATQSQATLLEAVTIEQVSALMVLESEHVTGFGAVMRVDLTGTPPWSIEYGSKAESFQIDNITRSPYYIRVNPLSDTDYLLISVSNELCDGIAEGRVPVNIDENDPPVVAGGLTKIRGNAETNLQFSLDYNPELKEYAWADGFVGQMRLGRLDAAGSAISEYVLDFEMRGHGVQLLHDRSMLVGGIVNASDASRRNYAMFRVSEDGNLMWMRELELVGREHQNRMTKSSDESVILTGWSDGISGEDVLFVKYDYDGNVVWKQELDLGGDDQLTDAIATPSGGVLFCGVSLGTQPPFFIGEVSTDGALLWARSLTVPGASATLYNKLVMLSDGSYVICGITNDSDQMFLVRLDQDGVPIWSKNYTRLAQRGASGLSWDTFRMAVDDDDNIYITDQNATVNDRYISNVLQLNADGDVGKAYTYINGHVSNIIVHDDGISLAGWTQDHPRGFGEEDHFFVRTDANLLNCDALAFASQSQDILGVSTAVWPAGDLNHRAVTSSENVERTPQLTAVTPLEEINLCCESQSNPDFALPAATCLNTTLDLLVTGAGPDARIEWNLNGRVISRAAETELEFTELGRHTLGLMVIDADCLIEVNKDIRVVSFAPLEVNDPGTLCIGDSFQLQASGGDTYEWSPPVGLSCTDCPNPILTAPEGQDPGVYLYNVIARIGNTCTSLQTVSVTFRECCDGEQAEALVIQHPYRAVCIEEPELALTANREFDPQAEYNWNFGPNADPQTSTDMRPEFKLLTAGAHEITLEYTDACGITEMAVDTLLVAPNPRVTPLNINAPCDGQTGGQIGGIGPSTFIYTWGPPTALSNPNIPNPTVLDREPREYVLTILNPATSCLSQQRFWANRGVRNTDLQLSNARELNFNAVNTTETVCRELEFRNSSPYHSIVLERADFKQNLYFTVPEEQFPFEIEPEARRTLQICWTPDQLGDYSDTLIVGTDCTQLEVPLLGRLQDEPVSTPLECGLNNVNTVRDFLEHGIAIGVPWPNPAQNLVNLRFLHSRTPSTAEPQVRLFNSLGQSIDARVQIQQSLGIQYSGLGANCVDITIDLNTVAVGVYFIELDVLGKRHTLTFVKTQ